MVPFRMGPWGTPPVNLLRAHRRLTYKENYAAVTEEAAPGEASVQAVTLHLNQGVSGDHNPEVFQAHFPKFASDCS